jgi:glycosyltransferase involved in cell wall biosynthesis
MRISLVSSDALPTPPPRYGGLEAVVAGLARGLAAAGHQVRLFAREGSPPGPYELVTFRRVAELAEGGDLTERLLEADMVHCHDWQGLAWELARRYPQRAFVATWHGPSLGPQVAWRRPPANLVLCGVSYWHAWSLSCELDAEVRAVPNGVDLDLYPLYTGPREGYLLHLGRLDPAKGVHRAIELARFLGMPLRIAGTEWLVPDPEYVRAILGRCDGRTIVYEGDLDLERKVHLLQRAAALVWLPTQWEEPFGLGLVEAMACGTPVVALDRGAVREVLGCWEPDGQRPWWADLAVVGHPADLPRATRIVVGSNPYGWRARAERYSLDAMVRRYLEVYEACTSWSPAARGSAAAG